VTVARRVNLGAQAAPGATQRLEMLPPFAPAAC
jgi:hypothetical protein